VLTRAGVAVVVPALTLPSAVAALTPRPRRVLDDAVPTELEFTGGVATILLVGVPIFTLLADPRRPLIAADGAARLAAGLRRLAILGASRFARWLAGDAETETGKRGIRAVGIRRARWSCPTSPTGAVRTIGRLNADRATDHSSARPFRLALLIVSASRLVEGIQTIGLDEAVSAVLSLAGDPAPVIGDGQARHSRCADCWSV